MERAKKERKVLRGSFTRQYNIITELIAAGPNVSTVEVRAAFNAIENKFEEIRQLDRTIFDEMLESDATEDELEAETEILDGYIAKYMLIKEKVDKLSSDIDSGSNVRSNSSDKSEIKNRIKLPKLEMRKFGGDPQEWLDFWGLFKKIHEETSIDNEEKFQYLVQCTQSGSRARKIVNSFPPTSENYLKAVEALQRRFGREDLLIEIYVRKLLGLVTSNRESITVLYDDLECQMRALDSLGVTSDKCSAMLLPLVESCLPEGLFRIWQRSNNDSTKDAKDKLNDLMGFIRSEVESEEKVNMAVAGIGKSIKKETKNYPIRESRKESVPTATGLVSTNGKPFCVFCDSQEHNSSDCQNAQSMTREDKKRVLINKGCCFFCLKVGHITKRCKTFVKCSNCQKRHFLVMCPNLCTQNTIAISELSIQNETSSDVIMENSLASFSSSPSVLLQTLLVRIRGANGYDRIARVMIDSGSQRSYILKSTASELNLQKISTENIIHCVFGGIKIKENKHEVYRVHLSNVNKTYMCNFVCLDQYQICRELPAVNRGPWINELKNYQLDVLDNSDKIEILLGADVAGKLITGKVIQLSSGLTLIETYLGWTLMGKYRTEVQPQSVTSCMVVTNLLVNEMRISDLWELDILGIRDPYEKIERECLEEAAIKHFCETVTSDAEGRYIVHLPWLEGHRVIPVNYELASRRLNSLIKRLEKDGYYCQYESVFLEWLKEGVIEEITNCDDKLHGHYLPHRAVIKPNSTTKVRPVFDASAHEKQYPSLNDCLAKGVNLIERIPKILHGFRFNKLGIISDIRKAFLQIGLISTDRNYLKFLWKNLEGNLKVYRHCRVVFGVTSSPFLLSVVIQYHLQKILEDPSNCFSKDVIIRLKSSFYVDNCVTSLSDQFELDRFVKQAQQVMLLGQFDLRGWEQSYAWISDEDKVSRVLGMLWYKETDTLGISIENLKDFNFGKITKRTLLSVAQRVFDPIGFTYPVSLYPKLMLQSLWGQKVKWDDDLNVSVKEKFLKWFNEIHYLSEIRIPRYFASGFSSKRVNISVHTFCDASQVAYAAACFIRIETEEGISVQLLQAKCRVAPIKKMTIPRLELMAATIGARLANSIKEMDLFGDAHFFYWTDSSTVLAWLAREEQWAVFVRNRIKEILKLSQLSEWKHVPGVLNPADLVSRGCSARKLVDSRWWEGPEWLKHPSSSWPLVCDTYDAEEVNKERRKIVSSCNINVSENEFIDFYRYFSKFHKLVRMIGWMLRFVWNCKNPQNKKVFCLSGKEIIEAELVLYKMVQEEVFYNEENTSIRSLCPYRDEIGLIRVKTKVCNRVDNVDFSYPILLPAKHPVIERLIREQHEKSCHAGVQILHGLLREKFWILRARRTIRSVVSKCVVCRRFSAKRIEAAAVALPVDRVRDASAFEIVGVDLAGPLYLKSGEKSWIALYTCAVYRAVHLELLSGLSTEVFIQSFRRFVARRGRPQVVFSDLGTNFVGTENVFKRLNWTEISSFSSAQRIVWKFNPATAAWWGGWWERLIQVLKNLLRRTLGKARLSMEEMITVLCDCEAVMNGRPLTYISENPDECCVLTPSMFIQDIRETGVPDCDAVDSLYLGRRANYRKRLVEDLRKRFRLEYLGELKHRYNVVGNRQIKVGEIVLVGNDSTKRIDWPLARVIKVLPGKDQNVRLVQLKTKNGELLRPVQRIFPLEIEYPELNLSKTQVVKDKTLNIQRVESDENIQSSNLPKDVIKTRSWRTIVPPDRLSY